MGDEGSLQNQRKLVIGKSIARLYNNEMKQLLVTFIVALLMVECGEKPGGDSPESSKKDGLQTDYYDNGQKKSEANWKDGKRDGLFTFWYENGKTKFQGNLKEGKHDGLGTMWYENGQKQAEESYKDGKRDGLNTSWYDNGQKKSEANYNNGKLDRLWTSWYDNGQKRGEVTYKEGKLMTFVSWKPDGDKCPDTNIFDGNGVTVAYNDKGTEIARLTYKDGEPVRN